MEAYRSKVLDKNAGIESLHSDIEQRELKHLVRRFKNIHSTNTHEPRTLDESHYLGLSNEQLSDRNKDQVVSRSEEKEEDRRVLMVSQLWLWRMDDVIVSACGSHSEEGSLDAGLDPQACLSQEFERGYLGTGNGVPALQLAALLFSECVNYIDRPYCAGLEEPVFYTFEKAVAMLNDEVKSYINHRAIEKIYLDKEMEFIHQIGDIRDELSIIRNVITEQKEIWDKFRKDLKDEIPKWKYINRSVALRPEEQIPKFLRRVEKIDEDAKRVEERIQVQLDLKKTHAGLKESHNSAVLSSAVIGFTIITIIFAPLSFMTSLLAVPGVELKWDWATGKKYLSKFTRLHWCQR